MRLEEATPEYAINYQPGDIATMRQALKRYAELIESDDAFSGGYCVAHFYHTGDHVPYSYFENHPDLLTYLKEDCYYFHESSSNMDDLQESMTGETLLFLCAVIHPELEEDLKNTCEVMVRYARELNNSADMWITCETPFGVDPIQIFVTRYPKYGYLLASFLVPNWDQEHMREPLWRLASWKNKLGITDDTLKAFCYADNKTTRENMLGYDSWDGYDDSGESVETNFDLIGYFRENPDEYEKFKQMLADRYREMPYLQFSDDMDEYNESPVYDLVVEMLYVRQTIDLWDEDLDMEEYLSQQFVDTDARQEIQDLTADIEKRLGHPIVLSEDEQANALEVKVVQEKQERAQLETPEADPWQEVITKVFPNGEDLWNYVITGENPTLLDTVKKTDVAKLAKKAKCQSGPRFAFMARHAGPMEEWVYKEMERYARECVELDPAEGREQVFRFYDIIHRCCGCAPLHRYTIRLFEKKLQIATEDELSERYRVPFKDEFKTFSYKIGNDLQYSDHHRNLPRFYNMLNRNPDEAMPILREWLNLEKPSKAGMVMAAYIALRDTREGNVRELTDIAIEFIETEGPRCIFDALSVDGVWPRYSEYHDIKDKEFDNDYQRGYQQKVLSNYSKWVPVEQYLLTGTFDELSGDDALNTVLNYFNRYTNIDEEESIADRQVYYECVGAARDEVTLAAVMCFFALQLPELKAAGVFQRFLQMGFRMSPFRIISCLSGILPVLKNSEDMDLFMEALTSLKPLGLADEPYWSYQLSQIFYSADVYEIDPEHPENEKPEHLHFFQLLKLALEGAESVRAMKKISAYLDGDLEAIAADLKGGTHLISRNRLMKILHYGDKVVKNREGITTLLDQLALSKVRRSLKKEMRRIPQYFQARLEQQGISCDEDSVSGNELKEALGVSEDEISKYFSVDQYEEIVEEILDDHQNNHYQWCAVQKTSDGVKLLYNEKMLRFGLWCAENKKDDRITSFHLFIADENCPAEMIEELEALKQGNYKEYWMNQFEAYLSGEIEFDSIKHLIECAIFEDDFLEYDGLNDVDLEEFIGDLSPDLQKRILALTEAKGVDLM